MPHLDEGTLQAYLDGARSGQTDDEREAIARHLAGCPSCADALEALAADGERATGLLGTSASEGPPPFEAIRRRAEAATGAAAPPPRRRWTTYRWAASVAVALGAGWLANDLLRTTPQAVVPAAGREEAAAGTLPAEAPAARGGPAVGVPVAAPPEAEVEVADTERRGAAGGIPDGMARERVATPDPGVGAAAPSAVPPPDTDAPAPPAPRESAPAASPATDLAAERVAPFAPSVLRGRVTDETGRPLEAAQVFVDGSETGTLTRADGTFALRLPARETDLFRDMTLRVRLLGYGEEARPIPATDVDTVAADIRLSSSALALSQRVVTGEATGAEPSPEPATVAPSAPAPTVLGAASLPAPWTPLDPERLEAAVGFAPLSVPELDVVSRELRLQDGVAEARIVQRLDDGGPLTLLQARGRPPSTAPDPAVETVIVQVGEVWVVASAGLTTAQLQALVDQLR